SLLSFCHYELRHNASLKFFFLSVILLSPISILFPYTTLFRSQVYKFNSFDEIKTYCLNNNLSLPEFVKKFDDSDIEIYLQKVFEDRKSTRLNSSHVSISYAVFCLKKKHGR